MKITLETAIEFLRHSEAVIVNDDEVLFPSVYDDEGCEEFLTLEDADFLSKDNKVIEFDLHSSCLNLISSEGNEYQVQLLQVGHLNKHENLK